MLYSQATSINDINQWLYVSSNTRQKSLLFLHGGPGWSDAPWAKVICENLWSHFNTIHWDQRGANRSFLDPGSPEEISIDQIIRDGIEVLDALKRDFRIERPILVGHSWGALLGVLIAERAPDLIEAYVGIGQLVSNAASEPLSLEFCKKQAKKLKREDLLAELEAMSTEFYRNLDKLFRQREILFELGGEFHKPVTQKEMQSWAESSSPEYRSTWEKMCTTQRYCMEGLWPEVIQMDLFERVKSLEVPITLLHSRYDYCTASSVAEKWFNELSPKTKKEWVWFENSAHWPQIEENEKFSRILVNLFHK